MPKLILVRHASPEQNPDVPARKWVLSEEGRLRCADLADKLAIYKPAILVSSTEHKAAETAEILAYHLDMGFELIQNLHEHDRRTTPYFPAVQTFEEAVANFFNNPNELVLGEETAVQAQARFSKAIETVVSKSPSDNLIVVAHGTVISLFVAAHNPLNVFEFWKNLALPAYTVLDLPDFKLIENV